jgi:cytosine/adenosine deaminase-related metal-dependent hydrolase
MAMMLVGHPPARLVRGRWVVTGAEAGDATITNGAVLVRDDRIEEVGSWSALRGRYPEADVSGSEDMAVIPGLINAHHHSTGVTSTQQGIGDDILELWILEMRRVRPGDPYLDTLLASARLLRSGVTQLVDMHQCRGPVAACKERIDHVLRAYDQAGIRVAFAPGVADQNQIVSGATKSEVRRFLDSLPGDQRHTAEGILPGPGHMQPDEYLALMETLRRRYEQHPRIDIWFGPPGPNWVSDDFMTRIAERTAAHDTRLQTHLSESLYEKVYGGRAYGRSTIHHLDALGVLSPRFTMAHAVWLTESEIAVLARTGAALSHNPSSNLRLRAGIAPVNALVKAGVTVGLGLDGRGLDDDDDIFREMRVALQLHRGPVIGSPKLEPSQVFSLATCGGALLVGKADRLGRIAPGYAADLVLVDVGRMTWPWTAPELDPRELLILRAQARDVRAVFVAGHLVMEDGRPTGFDLESVGRELADRLAATPFPAEMAGRLAALREHAEAFYRGWEMPVLDPYTRYNSRT